MGDQNFKIIGKGIYTISEASRLTRINSRKIRRWLEGYSYISDQKRKALTEVISADYREIDESHSLSFLDMIEMLFVDHFLKSGVSLNSIRIASKRAQQILNLTHPFSSKKFKSDGRTIFMNIAYEEQSPDLLDLVKNQIALNEIMSPFLYDSLKFNNDDVAELWWPLKTKRSIVINPARNFGEPIIDEHGIPTATISESVKIEGSIRKVSLLYEIDYELASDAVEFEQQIAA